MRLLFVLLVLFVHDAVQQQRHLNNVAFCTKPGHANHWRCTIGGKGTKPSGKPGGSLKVREVAQLKRACDKSNCNETKQGTAESRTSILQHSKKVFGDAEANRMVTLNFNVKKALFDADGISSFAQVPDDGMVSGYLLSSVHAERVLARINGGGAEEPPASPPRSEPRQKRHAVFLGDEPSLAWDVSDSIKYHIESTFSSTEVAIIERGLLDIATKTCLYFERVSSPPAGQHIRFLRSTNAAFCGLSVLGRVSPYNPIWLNFKNHGCVQLINGTVMHETLHALGVDHEHNRYDRDDFIRINWDNIDPRNYDWYRIMPGAYSTYGIEYDYMSITHYGTNIGVIDIKEPSMIALKEAWYNQPVMGQRDGLSSKDAQLLNKMYCMPKCNDLDKWCGHWATNGYCKRSFRSMEYWCKKSCDLCPADAVGV